jgi:hypothetical protein
MCAGRDHDPTNVPPRPQRVKDSVAAVEQIAGLAEWPALVRAVASIGAVVTSVGPRAADVAPILAEGTPARRPAVILPPRREWPCSRRRATTRGSTGRGSSTGGTTGATGAERRSAGRTAPKRGAARPTSAIRRTPITALVTIIASPVIARVAVAAKATGPVTAVRPAESARPWPTTITATGRGA